ncbi:Hypothetical predicted protein [Lecanosticta acicola]|uniref:Thioester reductase (TE) domain-containing protein n=1 Tax=Lecanosticta acicola TaxID=111012 RepID=A0AAI9E7Q3_9PEZI|nr:Hypothetical predicted protein [Lecanosticta acicola]
MKIILIGSTGFIGTEILTQAIAHNYISHIYILTRRPLTDPRFSQTKKVTQLLHEDFEAYPASLLARLREENVEACIWSLGRGKLSSFQDLDEARRVNVNFACEAAEAFAKSLGSGMQPYEGYPQSPPKVGVGRFPFRFVYVSCWGAEQDQFRKLWAWSESRKIKGAAEKALFAIADGSEEKGEGAHRCFEVIALRPGGVLKSGGDSVSTLLTEAVVPSIAVDRLARAAIKAAFDGTGVEGKRILENKDCLGPDWSQINSFTF